MPNQTKVCSKCRLEKPIGEFHNRKKPPGGKDYYCKLCSKEYSQQHRKQNVDMYRKAGREFALRVKQRCVESKGGKCQICGYNKCLAALEFHHLDPTAKDFTIGRNGYRHGTKWSEKTQQELNKCILVCANCHRELHHLKGH